MPAFATTRSSGSAAAIIRSTSSRFETSPTTAAPPISVATASTWSLVRPVTVTCQPAVASSRAIPAPIPRPPPVTSALDTLRHLRARRDDLDGVRGRALAPPVEEELESQRLEAGADHVRGAVAPDIGRLAERRLDHDATGVAHQRVEGEDGGPLRGGDQPVQVRLPDRHLGGEDETPEHEEEEREREVGGQAQDREQDDAHARAEDQRGRPAMEHASDPRGQVAAGDLRA